MIHSIMSWLITSCMTLAILISFVWLIRHWVNRFLSPVCSHRLWLIVFIVLLPISLPVDWQSTTVSMPNVLLTEHNNPTELTDVIKHEAHSTQSLTNFLSHIYQYFTQQNFWFYVWLTGFLLSLATHLLKQIIFQQKVLKHSCDIHFPKHIIADLNNQISIKQSQHISTPMVIGLFKPVLLLPHDFGNKFSAEERHLMLQHEMLHIQNHDLLKLHAFVLLTCVFWFHPWIHLAFKCFRQDMEFARDFQILSKQNFNTRKSYGMALIKAINPHQRECSYATAFSFKVLKERTMLLKHHQHSPSKSFFSLILIAFTFIAASFISACASSTAQEQTANNPHEKIQQDIELLEYEAQELEHDIEIEIEHEAEESDENYAVIDQKKMHEARKQMQKEMKQIRQEIQQQARQAAKQAIAAQKQMLQSEKQMQKEILQAKKQLRQVNIEIEKALVELQKIKQKINQGKSKSQ